MKRFDTGLSLAENALFVLGCVALAIMAVLINADILGRSLFRMPLQIQFELVERYLMPAVAVLPLSKVYRDGGHLAIEFIGPKTFGRFWPFVRAVMLLSAAAFFGAMTFMSGRFAAEAFIHGRVYFGIVDWPLGWAYSTVPAGCAVLTVRLLYELTKRGAKSAPD